MRVCLCASCSCALGRGDAPTSDGPAFGVDVGVTNLRLAFADSMEMRPEVSYISLRVHALCV